MLLAIEEHALTPEAVEQVIRLTERDDVQEQQMALVEQRDDIAKRLARVMDALEQGGDVAALLSRARELETNQKSLDADIVALRPVPRLAPQVVEGRLAEWRRLLRGNVTQGRAVLQRVLQGRLTVTPAEDGRSDTFEGPTRFAKLFTGLVAEPPPFVRKATREGPNTSRRPTPWTTTTVGFWSRHNSTLRGVRPQFARVGTTSGVG